MKETEELVSSKISVSQICLFRKGSDIDLQAIFGGRLSSKRKTESKTNPVYKDGQNGLKKGDNSENDMGGLEIQVYKNIPTEEYNHKNDIMKEQLKKENSRDKVTVTNGEVCVGDIIIENGYRNPAFDSDGDHGDIQVHTLNYSGEGEGKANMSGSDWPNIDDIALPANQETLSQDEAYECIDYNRNSTKVISVDPSNIDIEIGDSSTVQPTSDDSGNQEKIEGESDSSVIIDQKGDNHIEKKAQHVGEDDCDKTLRENNNVESGENDIGTSEQLNNEVSDKIESNCTSQSDLKIVSANNEKCQLESQNSENGQLDQSLNDKNHSETKLNGSVRSNISIKEIEQGKDSCNEKEKSKKKNKKLKQRKNSLPDHVLNSLNMKPTKPILVPMVTDDSAIPACRTRSAENSNEQKSVKFSDDTVFNDHKPNKYKQERVTLKDIYKGKISSKEAVAKLNPMFVDEDNQGIKDGDSENQNDLNTPAYMKDFVIAHGTSVRRPGLEVDNDIESIGSEGAANYDKLIERTLARKRRSRILRFSCALFTFLVVIAVVIVLVMFVGKKQS